MRDPGARHPIHLAVLLPFLALSACTTTSAVPTTSTPSATQTAQAPIDLGVLGLVLTPAPGFAGTVPVAQDPDGSFHATVVGSPTGEDLGTLTSTDNVLVPLSDGSMLVTDSDGAPLGGVAPTGAWITATADGSVSVEADDGDDLWIGTQAVNSLEWGVREGGESLAVEPTAFGRSGSRAAEEMIWAAVRAQPGADITTMHDQLTCHMMGAPDKATWNLEPWRPEVEYLALLSALCNPE